MKINEIELNMKEDEIRKVFEEEKDSIRKEFELMVQLKDVNYNEDKMYQKLTNVNYYKTNVNKLFLYVLILLGICSFMYDKTYLMIRIVLTIFFVFYCKKELKRICKTPTSSSSMRIRIPLIKKYLQNELNNKINECLFYSLIVDTTEEN